MKKILFWLGILVIVLLLIWGVVWFLERNSSSGPLGPIGAIFGVAQQNTGNGSSGASDQSGNTPLTVGGNTSSSTPSKIFLITSGPIVAGTLIQEGIPTTTNARYITADDGHVLDQQLDVPGAFPHVVSQTTIPGVKRAFFTDRGTGALLQYLEGSTIKTVHVSFHISSSTDASAIATTVIQFLPDNIEDVAVSPDTRQIVYLLHTAAGLDGYVSASDGSSAHKLFSLSLTQVALSWTAPGAIIAYSKASAGIPGIVFSINTKSGAVSPLLYGQGITAVADAGLAHLLYQIADGNSLTTYIDTTSNGSSSVAPSYTRTALPEQCVAPVATVGGVSFGLVCAAPLAAPGGNFLDLWHQGIGSAADGIVGLNLVNAIPTVLAIPGTGQGGETSDIVDIAISPDGHYLSFINKNNGKLWGVRLLP